MKNEVLDFLEAYKSLDKLCKETLMSDKGVTQYITEMDLAPQGKYVVSGWVRDYKQLKHLRHFRNHLVHDTNSFEEEDVCLKDTCWLNDFYQRILEGKDPIALLHLSQQPKKVRNAPTLNTSTANINTSKMERREEIKEKHKENRKVNRKVNRKQMLWWETATIALCLVVFWMLIISMAVMYLIS